MTIVWPVPASTTAKILSVSPVFNESLDGLMLMSVGTSILGSCISDWENVWKSKFSILCEIPYDAVME